MDPEERVIVRLSKKTNSKASVKACDELGCDIPEVVPEGGQDTAKYDAYHHIMEAIDSLKECDPEDSAAIEAISNLAVVAFSLK